MKLVSGQVFVIFNDWHKKKVFYCRLQLILFAVKRLQFSVILPQPNHRFYTMGTS